MELSLGHGAPRRPERVKTITVRRLARFLDVDNRGDNVLLCVEDSALNSSRME